MLCISCNNNDNNGISERNDYTLHASGFTVVSYDGYSVVEVVNPWKKNVLLQRYIIAPQDVQLPDTLPQGVVLRTPLKNVVVYSSVHANIIKELGHIDAIGGVCDAQYFYMPEIVAGLADGTVVNVGNSMAPVAEKLIALSPDAIILSPYQNGGYMEKIPQGTAVVECADYMEVLPLGRAEWIKLFGLLFNEEAKADSIYNAVVEEYQFLKNKVVVNQVKPKVLSENIINGTWYVPGGKSYMAQIFQDAGADYPWSETETVGSIPLDMSQVLAKAHDADVWLIKSLDADFSYDKLKKQHALNEKFKAFTDKKIYYCNTAQTTLFEDFPFHPEVLLQEYIAIFYPELAQEYTPKYFKPLNEN